MPSLRTPIKVSLRQRLEILANIVYELIRTTGYESQDLYEIIRKGILDNQALQSLEVVFITGDSMIISSVVFKFNWDSKSLTIDGTDADLVSGLNLEKPITNQIGTVLKETIEEVSRRSKDNQDFDHTTLYCQYVADLETRTGKSRDQWNDDLGLVSLSEEEKGRYAKFKDIALTDNSFGGMLAVGLRLNMAYFQ